MKLFSSLSCSFGAAGLLLLAAAPAAEAQTGIGTRTPDASSALDISSANRGLLIPRVALTGVNDGNTVPSPANALLVYNTSSALAGPGFYFNAGQPGAPNWERFVSSAAPVGLEFWRTTGNANTTGANFLGTIDKKELSFRVENIERFRITPPRGNARDRAEALLTSDFEVVGKTTLAGDVNVTGNNSIVTLRNTNIGIANERGVLSVFGDATISAGSSTPNGTPTGGTLTVNGATFLRSTLSVLGVPTFATLGGSGSRLVVADGSGNLSAQSIAASDFAILNQSANVQNANFNISGNGRVGGTLNVGGATTLGGLSAGTTTLGATSVNGTLSVTNNTGLTTLSTSGLAALASALVNGNLNVSGVSNLGILSAGVSTLGASTLASAKVSNLNGTDVRVVVAAADGTLSATSSLPGSNGEFIQNQNANAQNATFNIGGTARIGSTLNVVGATTLGGLAAGTTSLGATTIGSTLNVTGNTTLTGLTAGATTLNFATVTNNLGAATVSTSGLATLNSARVTTLGGSGGRLVVTDNAGNLGTQAFPTPIDAILNQSAGPQTASFNIAGSGQVGTTLGVGTNLSVGGTLGVTGASTLNSVGVTTNATIGGTLGVTGAATVTGASTLNGATTVNNTLSVTGNTGLSTLSTSALATLASARVSNLGNGGTRMVVANNSGDLSTAALPGSAGEFIANTGSLSTPSFNITGTGRIGGTLNVAGTTTLADLNAGSTSLGSAVIGSTLSAGSLTVSGASALNSTLVVTGQTQLRNLGISQGNRLVIADGNGILTTQEIPTPINAILNQTNTVQSASFNLSGTGQLNALTVNGNSSIGGSQTIAGTLGVTGLSTLRGVDVIGSATMSGTLGVTGNTALTTLGTSGLATLASARVANLTVAGMVVNDANGILTTQPLPTPINAILNQRDNNQPADFQISGSGQVGALTVTGSSSLGSLTAGATTLSSASITGALGAGASTLNSANVTTTLSVDGATTLKNTLGVTGATTLASLTAGPTTLGTAQVTNLRGAGSRLVVTDNDGNLSAQNFPSPGVAILNQIADPQAASFNIAGSGQVGTTLGVGTNLTVGGTLGVTGSTSLSSSLAVSGISSLTGNVGIGTAPAAELLTVAGNVVPNRDENHSLGTSALKWEFVYSKNGVINTSDGRLKTNVTGLSYGLSTIMALRPVRYAWKKTPNQTNKIGFIAQELEKVVPEVVSVGTDANQTLGVNYAELVPVLVKALQEQQAQLDTMRGRAEKAEAAVQSFESRLRALEAGSSVNATAQGQR